MYGRICRFEFHKDAGLNERQEIADKGVKETLDPVKSMELAEGVGCEVNAPPVRRIRS